MKTPVSMLLQQKSDSLVSVAPDDTVQEAVARMNARKLGSVVVLAGGALRGIFTERDVLTRVVAAGRDPKTTRIHEVMTAGPLTISPENTLEEVMKLISERRVRHLPVLDEGRIVGLISMGDITKWLVRAHRAEAESLRSYVSGGYPA
jgi:CBS domain-containing protein